MPSAMRHIGIPLATRAPGTETAQRLGAPPWKHLFRLLVPLLRSVHSQIEKQTAPYVPLPLRDNSPLIFSVSQVHSTTQSGDRNNRKRKGDSDGAGSDQATAASNKRHHHRKFGCPYLKIGYSRSELSRACFGPGWSSIHHFK